MDWFVCGEFASISCSTWIAFWNGAIGAVIAAVLGALVALLVVRLTNAQQRHGVERTVEIAAVADCVAAIENVNWLISTELEHNKVFDAHSHLLPMRAAVARLQMSSPVARPIADLLIHWPSRVSRLAMTYQSAIVGELAVQDEILDALDDVVTTAIVCLPRCTSAVKKERVAALDMLRQADKALSAALEKFGRNRHDGAQAGAAPGPETAL